MGLPIHVIAAMLSASGARPVETLVLFDSETGGNFATAFDYPTDATLTVASGSVSYVNTGSANQLRVALKGPSGGVLLHALDNIRIDAALTIGPYPANDDIGAQIGFGNPGLGYFYGHEQKAHPAGASFLYARTLLTNYAPRESDTISYEVGGAGSSVSVRVEYSFGTLVSRVNYASTGERVLDVPMTLTATSDELPRLFSDAGGITFRRGTITVNSLRISAAQSKNVPYFLLGDSILQGRFASTFADGWGSRLRTAKPGQVVVCGAPSATSLDWSTRMDIVQLATPRRVFLNLGVNDIGNGVTLEQYQTRMGSILSQLDALGIPAVLLAITPTNNASTPTWNAWLAGLGRPYIDIFTPIANGNALAAVADSGDGVHPNSAGHETIFNTVNAAITANGW